MHSPVQAEARLNSTLRRADWRFLLRQAEEPGDADLIALQRPGRAELRRAHTALRPGGEVRCEWRLPLPGGTRRARRALERAGFEDVRLHWSWPPTRRSAPQFWLPLGVPAATRHLFRLRPAANRGQAAARRLWRLGAAIGALAPLSAVARKPGGTAAAGNEEIEVLLDRLSGTAAAPRAWLLLTGGQRSINKVVGLPFSPGDRPPGFVVKFARVPAAEDGLRREAAALETIAAEHPALSGVPRLLASGRRAGRLAVAETAIHGRPLLDRLDPESFPEFASAVTEWLLRLATKTAAQPRDAWWGRLAQQPLEDFERDFGPAGGAKAAARARALLRRLPELPLVCEHRDCSPWNIVLTGDGQPALLDWESAEPRGLPGLDLVYFLANAAFVLDGALESGRTHEAYARLLDPATPSGEVFANCTRRYCEGLGLGTDTLVRLRLLCWLVHCRSDYRHFEMDVGMQPDPEALRGGLYLGLLQEDLGRLENA